MSVEVTDLTRSHVRITATQVLPWKRIEMYADFNGNLWRKFLLELRGTEVFWAHNKTTKKQTPCYNYTNCQVERVSLGFSCRKHRQDDCKA